MVEAICKNCATHCHQGHNLQEYTDTRGYGGYTGRCNCNHEPPSKDLDNMEVCQAAPSEGNVMVTLMIISITFIILNRYFQLYFHRYRFRSNFKS